MEKIFNHFQKCGRGRFVRFVCVRVGVATWANKLALRLGLFYILLNESNIPFHTNNGYKYCMATKKGK